MAVVATGKLDELADAARKINRTIDALRDVRRNYNTDVANVKSVVFEAAPGIEVKVRF